MSPSNPYRIITPEAEASQPMSGEAVARSMFSVADPTLANSAQILSENDINRAFIHDMYFYIDTNKDLELSADESKTYEFKTYVFISRDYTFLEQAFNLTAPASNEICIYLEDNGGDLISEAGSWIRVGSDFRNEPDILNKILSSDYLMQNIPIGSLNLTKDILQDLIDNGYYEFIPRNILLSIFGGIQYLNYPVFWVLGKIGEGLNLFTDTMRAIKFKDEHWDPEEFLKTKGTDTATEFEPFLFPYSNELLEAIFENTTPNYTNTLIVLKESLASKKTEFNSFLIKAGTLQANIPGSLLDSTITTWSGMLSAFQSFMVDKLTSGIDFIIASVDQIFEMFESLGTQILSGVNAFICGFWNAIVEAVLGLIDLIAFIFTFSASVNEYYTNATDNLYKLKEIVDECIQSALKIDFSEIFNELKENIGKINVMAFLSNTSVERFCYFLGGFVGFILEILVGELTGGISSFAALLRKMGTVGQKILAKLTKSISTMSALGSALSTTRNASQVLLSIIKTVWSILKAGTQEILNLIGIIFTELMKAVKVSAEVLRSIMKSLKLTKSDISALEKMGLSFTSFSDNIANACKLTS